MRKDEGSSQHNTGEAIAGRGSCAIALHSPVMCGPKPRRLCYLDRPSFRRQLALCIPGRRELFLCAGSHVGW